MVVSVSGELKQIKECCNFVDNLQAHILIIIIIKSLFKEGKPNEHLPIFLGALKHSKIQNTLYISNNE